MSLACFCFEVIMAISSQNFAICIYWLQDEKKRNSKILRKYLATNMHQYMMVMVILSSWDLFALLSGNRTIAATMLCRVYTHVWSPIKVNYVDIKSSRSTENPEGFLHPPSLGIPTTLLSSLHCHHSTKLHTNTLTITRQIHKSATEKYGKMQRYKHLPKQKLHCPLQPSHVQGFCAQMLKKNNKMHNYEMITQKKGKKFTSFFEMPILTAALHMNKQLHWIIKCNWK